MSPWLILGLVASRAGLAIAVWWFRREAVAARAKGDLLQVQADRAAVDLTAAQAAAAEENTRQKGAIHVGDDIFELYQEAIEQMVDRHPDLSREYSHLVMRLAASRQAAPGAPDPGVHGPGSTGPAPDGTGGAH